MLDSRMNHAAENGGNVTARAFVTFPQMLSGGFARSSFVICITPCIARSSPAADGGRAGVASKLTF